MTVDQLEHKVLHWLNDISYHYIYGYDISEQNLSCQLCEAVKTVKSAWSKHD